MQRMFIVNQSNLTEKLKKVMFSPSKLSSLKITRLFLAKVVSVPVLELWSDFFSF